MPSKILNTNPAIEFIIGNENKPVVAEYDFQNSIFNTQFRIALNILNNYCMVKDNGSPELAFQGISFCGERGVGKTSAMLSFRNIINFSENKHLVPDNHTTGIEFIRSVLGDNNAILQNKLDILRPIDPSRFTNYNILEVVISELYEKVIQLRKSDKEQGREGNIYSYNQFLKLIQLVKRSMEFQTRSRERLFDELEDLNDLTCVVNLQENVRKVIKEYLQIIGATKLIITIDDLDLKISGVYDMVDRLRKYLSMPEVVVLMAVRVSQLRSAVRHAIVTTVNNDSQSFPESEISEMAEKYLVKMFPEGSRIYMPVIDRIFDFPFRVYDHDRKKIYQNSTLKDGVLELIFMKTRYLFYNSLGEISTLFPDNLRELFHLIGMLAEMKKFQKKDDAVHRSNQQQFKNYFFGMWTESLEPDYRKKALEWSHSPTDYTLNKDVVRFLYEKLGAFIKRISQIPSDESLTDKEEKDRKEAIVKTINSITSPDTYTYNVSLGDVFFILDILEKEILPDKDYRFIFFIRSLYSIKLYDKYDYITHRFEIYPSYGESGGIYRNDARFNHVNELQRLINGSYFTFMPSDLITTPNDITPYDRRVIKGKDALNELIEKVVEDNHDNAVLMRVAEFFVLTVNHIVTSKKSMSKKQGFYPVDFMAMARKDMEPLAYSKFSSQRGFYEFNVMAPFANLVNLRYSYSRFNDGEKLFEKALKNPDSLLCRMWKTAFKDRQPNENWETVFNILNNRDEDNDDLSKGKKFTVLFHSLISGSIIRNAEVLVALLDTFNRQKDELSRKKFTSDLKSVERLANFYSSIASISAPMTTHRFEIDENGNGVRHNISFMFCQALSDFLRELMTLGPENEAVIKFMEIYDWKDETENKTENHNQATVNITNLRRKITKLFELSTPREEAEPDKRSFEDLYGFILEHAPELILDEEAENALESLRVNYVDKNKFDTPLRLSTWNTHVGKDSEIWDKILNHSLLNILLS